MAKPLSPSRQDYLEVIYLLGDQGREPVSVSQVAERLNVKLPTVTRTVRALARGGYLRHRPRGPIEMTGDGIELAAALHHIHQDLMQWLTEVLGVPAEIAEADASQLEHGLSPVTARRLHQWLLMLDNMDPDQRPTLGRREGRRQSKLFENLPANPSAGWRA